MCSPREARELSSRAGGALGPRTPSVAALRDSLAPLSPPWRWQKAAEPGALTATSRAAKPARATTPMGQVGARTVRRRERPEATPARAKREARGPTLGSGLGAGEFWAVGSPSHPRLRMQSSSPAGKGAIDPSVEGPGLLACFSNRIYNKCPETPKRKRLAGKGAGREVRLLIRSGKKGEAAGLGTGGDTHPRTQGTPVSRSLLTYPQIR